MSEPLNARQMRARAFFLEAAIDYFNLLQSTTGDADVGILIIGLFPESERPGPPPPTAADVVEACTEIASPTDACSICLEDSGAMVSMNNCKHTFHLHCIGKWVDTKKRSCPVCRRDMFAQE
jgi:hypothetical protein